jgi:hypothetical protein
LCASQNFGGHVERGAEHGVRKLLIGEKLGEAEVSDFDFAVVHEDVGEFEIAVHDLVLVECLEGIEDLDEELDRFLLGEGLVLLEVLGEVALVAVFEDEVEIVGSLLDVVELDDVSIIAGLEHLDFVLEEFQELA